MRATAGDQRLSARRASRASSAGYSASSPNSTKRSTSSLAGPVRGEGPYLEDRIHDQQFSSPNYRRTDRHRARRCRRLRQEGAKVVVSGRRDEAGKALVEELRAFGSEAEFINADVRKEDDVRNMVDTTVARFGRLDVAVNNAATEGQVGPITDQTTKSFAATFETNVLGVVLSMKHEVRAMQTQGNGNIINISSTYGHEGAAFASIYVGAKHAVEGITKSVALELAKSGIRVNAVAPGPTDTGM